MRSTQSAMVLDTGDVPLGPPWPALDSMWMRTGPLAGPAAAYIAAAYL